jgi:hypothetical protein
MAPTMIGACSCDSSRSLGRYRSAAIVIPNRFLYDTGVRVTFSLSSKM